eukprot:TRINITY_DN10682_c0_g3_i2.p1 TRINITY_DN10682_c0_g3~~TRINITY_DN10682_c0_g3_i2.p1  ORF type:complete len:587 (-),score=73.32 TRINITY_DN10682_c0_g3_i2:278-1909(-)
MTQNGVGLQSQHALVLVLDFGSQYTQLITRRVREIGLFSKLVSGDAELSRIQSLNPKALILSGGPNSVHAEGAPTVASGVLEHAITNKIPVLGICYGMQLLVQLMGGAVQTVTGRGEYGRMEIQLQESAKSSELAMFKEQRETSFNVWMSHGDEVVKLPDDFEVCAKSQGGAIVGIQNTQKSVYGLQYHPEVVHTENGTETLRYFLKQICGLAGDWSMAQVKDELIQKVRQQVGPDDHAICALSGGVDSTVAATLVHEVMGDRLHCVFVDNGLLRYKEGERVMSMFQKDLHLDVTMVDHSQVMLDKLKGVSDPEKKRKLIGGEFINVFRDFAKKKQEELGIKPKFLLQGTLYPDVIESKPPPGSGQKHSHTIKSHHNVGGLPEDLDFELIEPLKELFKDEVRELGVLLGVPQTFIRRHPFPGPGLAVRVLGDVTINNSLEVLREVDEIFIESIKEFGLYDKIWQAFAVFLPVKSVGVQGDQRTHTHVVALRAVTSKDGMTADWYPFESSFLQTVSARICNKVKGVNRVVYDITSKPPGTIEWE